MQVEVLGRDDGVVVLVLAAAVLVGGETTLHSRLVGDVARGCEDTPAPMERSRWS